MGGGLGVGQVVEQVWVDRLPPNPSRRTDACYFLVFIGVCTVLLTIQFQEILWRSSG